MIVADASCLIALRDPAAPHHTAAVAVNDATRATAVATFDERLVAAAAGRGIALAGSGLNEPQRHNRDQMKCRMLGE